PCSAMLLPAFFSYAFTGPKELVARTGVFYLGLATSLVPLGVLAGTLGAFVNEHRFTFVTVASIIVIVLGALMLLNVPIPILSLLGHAAAGVLLVRLHWPEGTGRPNRGVLPGSGDQSGPARRTCRHPGRLRERAQVHLRHRGLDHRDRARGAHAAQRPDPHTL